MKLTNTFKKSDYLFNKKIKNFASYFIGAIIVIICFLLFKESKSGDAAIYFVYFKNFFNLPFSFQKSIVSFGATSPIHVIVFSFIYQLTGKFWLISLKFFNFLLFYLGVILLIKTFSITDSNKRNSNIDILLTVFFFSIINLTFLESLGQIFETGLIYFCISLIYYLLKNKNITGSIFTAGSLNLVRPELVLITLSIFIYLFLISENKKSILIKIIISLIPSIIYYLYMYINTGYIIPSSIYGRMVFASEFSSNWFNKVYNLFPFLSSLKRSLTYILGILSIIYLSVKKKNIKIEMVLTLPIIFFYLIFPPGSYITRYWIPLLPIFSVLIYLLINEFINSKKLIGIELLGIFIVLSGYGYLYSKGLLSKYNYDNILLYDLAKEFNKILDKSDNILLYEIQGQYYISGNCYSMDGIVGNQIIDVIKGEMKFEDFLRKYNIKYVVNHSNIRGREIFLRTALSELYYHDINSNIGDSIVINNIVYTKILTNPEFENPKNFFISKDEISGRNIRTYYENTFWNSVYRIKPKVVIEK